MMNKIPMLALSVLCWTIAGCDELSNGQIPNHPAEESIIDMLVNPQKFTYPPIEQQRIELERFSDAIEAMNDGADRMLRRMVERVPIQFIEKEFPKLQKNEATSERARENMSKLLGRIRHFRELDQTTAPAFIFRARQNLDVDALCVCIFTLGTEPMQAFAADALRTIGDPKSARCLFIGLIYASTAWGGGSEQQADRYRSRLSFAKAFGDVTHIDVSDYDGSDEDRADLKKIIQQGEVWLEEHEEKL